MKVKVYIKKKSTTASKKNNLQNASKQITTSTKIKCKTKRHNLNTKAEKVGFWKAVGLIIINREPKTGQTTAFLLAEVLAYIFNAIAIVGAAILLICLKATFCDLDWSGECRKNVIQGFIAAILLVGIGVVSLIFRAMANDIKAEKDRNYIVNLFFGFAGFASLIIALFTFFKE